MKPYYAEDGITIYHGDARDVLPSIAASCLMADPPYDERGGWLVAEWASKFQTAAVFGYPELLVGWCVDAGIVPTEWVTWWPRTPKPVSGGAKLPVSSESIALFGTVAGGASVRRPRASGDRFLKAVHADRGHDPNTARLGDVWTDAAPNVGFNSYRRLHPNEKPLSVMLNLLRLCQPSGPVVDPFMGSGTTLRAAKDLGYAAIGIESEERYCEVAVQRLAQGVLALSAPEVAEHLGGGE